MRRLHFILINTLWIGAVTWYWRENVPLVPTRSVDVPIDRLAGMLSPAGELVVIPTRATGGRLTQHGPLEFWSFPEVRKIRETLTADDEIVWGPNYLGSEALIRRLGTLALVNAYTGEHLTTLPDLSGVKEFRMVPGRRQILVQQNRDIHLFEFGQLESRWTIQNFRIRSSVANGIFTAMAYANQSARLWTAVGATAINVESGEIDHRFDHAGPSSEIELSADGRWAVVEAMDQRGLGSDKRSVCDAATGFLLWTIPLVPRIDYCWFPKGGSDLLALEAAISDERHFRWNAADGTRLPPPTSAEQRVLYRRVTSDGQYAYADSNVSPPRIVTSWLNHPTWLPTKLREWLWTSLHRHRCKVIAQQPERLIGYFPDFERVFVLPDKPGFATFRAGRISYYALPLRHNWTWLVLWSLLPPAALVLLSRVRQCLRLPRAIRRPAAGDPA